MRPLLLSTPRAPRRATSLDLATPRAATPCNPMHVHLGCTAMCHLASYLHVPCCLQVPTLNPTPTPNQVRLLAPEPLEELRLAEETDSAHISDALRESIEAAAVILGVRPDFSTAQARLVPMA